MKYKILKKDPMFQNDKDIFQLGKRDGNTKRNFLFLSKWIGKHLECNPSDFTKIVTELSKKINMRSISHLQKIILMQKIISYMM